MTGRDQPLLKRHHWRRCGERISMCILAGNINYNSHMDNKIEIFKKLKIQFSYYSGIQQQDYIQKK